MGREKGWKRSVSFEYVEIEWCFVVVVVNSGGSGSGGGGTLIITSSSLN